MNDLIKRLAEQAELNATLLFNKDKLEKFAELIVRDCVQTLIDKTPEWYTNEASEEDWDKGYDRAMKDCVHHIKEHFGVEE